MIKLVFCLRRQPHLSREEFQRYWFDRHGLLVRSVKDQLHIRRYVQVHTSDSPPNHAFRKGRGGPEAYDGEAELWWDTEEDLKAEMESDAGREASDKNQETSAERKERIRLENAAQAVSALTLCT